MSTISASTTSTTAYKVTADTTGTLVLQTGSTPTTAVTIDGSQNVTLAGNITLNNGAADGAQLTLASSGFSNWNIDNYSGNFRWYYNTTEYMRLDASGNLGIGATSASASLQIQKAVPSFWMAETTSGTLQRVECSVSSVGVFNQNLNWNAGSASRAFTWSQGGTENMRIDTSGVLLVGATSVFGNGLVQIQSATSGQISLRHSAASAGAHWRMGPDSSANDLIVYSSSTGGVYITNTGTSWVGRSDERLKDIIEPITNAVSKVSSLRAVIGKFKTDEQGTRRSFLIAQDVQAVLPEAVSVSPRREGEDTDYLGVSYTDTIPLLVAAIKEQQTTIETLTNRITALEAK